MNYILITAAIFLPIAYMNSRLLLQNTDDQVTPSYDKMCFNTQLTQFTFRNYINIIGQYDLNRCRDTLLNVRMCYFSRAGSDNIELQTVLSPEDNRLIAYSISNKATDTAEINCSNDPNWLLAPPYLRNNTETNELDEAFTCRGNIQTTDSEALKQAQLIEGSCSGLCDVDLSGDSGQCIIEGSNTRLRCCGTDATRYEVVFYDSDTCSGGIPSDNTEISAPSVDPICCGDINKQNCPSEVYNIQSLL